MKFKKLLAIALITTPLLTACSTGNKNANSVARTFKHAIIKLPDDTIIKGNVKEWTYRHSDTFQITLEENNPRRRQRDIRRSCVRLRPLQRLERNDS